jgi:hypothetical protein
MGPRWGKRKRRFLAPGTGSGIFEVLEFLVLTERAWESAGRKASEVKPILLTRSW